MGYVPQLPSVEPRLQKRHQQLVQEHLAPAQRLAAGLRALPRAAARAFASAQAAWRFFKNHRVTLPALAQPLLEVARAAAATDCQDYGLVVWDWSQLHYNSHPSKEERIELSRSGDLGYELLTALLLTDQDGAAVAPLYQALRCAGGVWDSRFPRRQRARSQLDALAPAMAFVEGAGLARPLVHIIDAEADSVAHYRRWHREGWHFLVRADANRLVLYEGNECLLSAVVSDLRQRGAFQKSRDVPFQGKEVQQWVAETTVTLHRPAKPHRAGAAQRVTIAGPPLALRLVVGELRAADGTVLAQWLLLTNVPPTVSAATVTQWYYWRWRVETYFKLLKSAGQQVEDWQQETALAVAKRLLIAGLACVVVWHLVRSRKKKAARFREWLMQLSGRQVKRGKKYTEPALLAGLWVLLQVLELLKYHSRKELQALAEFVLPRAGPPQAETKPLV